MDEFEYSLPIVFIKTIAEDDMDNMFKTLKVLRFVYILYVIIDIILIVSAETYIYLLRPLFSLVCVCWIFSIAIHFVEETIRLRDDLEQYKETTNSALKKVNHRLNNCKTNDSMSPESSPKYSTILSAMYKEENGKRQLIVNGKYTFDETVGVKCPLCCTISPARQSKCQKCDLTYYFK